MRAWAYVPFALCLNFVTTAVHADEVCSAAENRAANAAIAKAKSAEAAGNLKQAFSSVANSDVRICGTGGGELYLRLALGAGREEEKAGRLEQAFDYFEQGQHYDDAKRVGLARFRSLPNDRNVASNLLSFMQRNDFADGAAEIEQHARAQAARLLAEEEKTFAIRTPHTELLQDAEAWLSVAGEGDAAEVKRRALQRADQFAALDYHYALDQALSYYQRADNTIKPAAVKAKARKLADGLASGNSWADAVALYELAGERQLADNLSAKREASAASAEAARVDTFRKEQDDLEKELGL